MPRANPHNFPGSPAKVKWLCSLCYRGFKTKAQAQAHELKEMERLLERRSKSMKVRGYTL